MDSFSKDPESFEKVLIDSVKLRKVVASLSDRGSRCLVEFLKNVLQEQGSSKLYIFAGNNPIGLVDPLGLATFPNPFLGFPNVPWPLNLLPPCSGPKDGQAIPQDDICSGPAAIFNYNPCLKQCCKEHDDCYTKNGCNWFSWIPGCGSSACKQCNSEAAKCFGNVAGETAKDPGPLHPQDTLFPPWTGPTNPIFPGF